MCLTSLTCVSCSKLQKKINKFCICLTCLTCLTSLISDQAPRKALRRDEFFFSRARDPPLRQVRQVRQVRQTKKRPFGIVFRTVLCGLSLSHLSQLSKYLSKIAYKQPILPLTCLNPPPCLRSGSPHPRLDAVCLKEAQAIEPKNQSKKIRWESQYQNGVGGTSIKNGVGRTSTLKKIETLQTRWANQYLKKATPIPQTRWARQYLKRIPPGPSGRPVLEKKIRNPSRPVGPTSTKPNQACLTCLSLQLLRCLTCFRENFHTKKKEPNWSVLCLSHLSQRLSQFVSMEAVIPENSQICPFLCLFQLYQSSQQRVSCKKTAKLAGFAFVSLVSLVSLVSGGLLWL